MSGKCVIGLDIGGTHARIGAAAPDGTLIHSRITSSKAIASGPPDHAIADLAAYIKEYISKYITAEIIGIAAAFPATIDAGREMLYSASNLGKDSRSRFDGLNIVKEMQPYFEVPFFLGKDSDFILYNDMHELAICTEEMVTGIYFGTGIGSSFYYRGSTIYGSDGVAGEIGHLPISDNSRQCTCGCRQGCCETVASGWRLVQIRDEYFPETPIAELFVRHRDSDVLHTYVYDCARVIALTGNLMNSAYTIVGGGIVNMPDFPRDRLELQVKSLLRSPYPRNTFRLLFSPNGQNAGIIGAAFFLLQKLSINTADIERRTQ